MNTTQLEDTLAAEISEHERHCELAHIDGSPCTAVAVAVIATLCTPVPQLACEVGVRRWVDRTALRLATGTRCPCGRTTSDCWSLVMLP